MADFSNTMKSGDLEANWQAAIQGSSLPKLAKSALRVYGRTFYLENAAPSK